MTPESKNKLREEYAKWKWHADNEPGVRRRESGIGGMTALKTYVDRLVDGDSEFDAFKAAMMPCQGYKPPARQSRISGFKGGTYLAGFELIFHKIIEDEDQRARAETLWRRIQSRSRK